MNLVLIRHGATQGNRERRYVGGRTNEPLCPEGREELGRLKAAGIYPPVDRLYASPMLRCRETAQLLYPEQPAIPLAGLKERDFGAFEGLTYGDLQHRPAYREWLDSAGESPIPEGEGKAAFRDRVLEAFSRCIGESLAQGRESVAVVSHGGAMMELLAAWGFPQREFYGWQAGNGRGFLLAVTPEAWTERRLAWTRNLEDEDDPT